jgi:hypothetical protein
VIAVTLQEATVELVPQDDLIVLKLVDRAGLQVNVALDMETVDLLMADLTLLRVTPVGDVA